VPTTDQQQNPPPTTNGSDNSQRSEGESFGTEFGGNASESCHPCEQGNAGKQANQNAADASTGGGRHGAGPRILAGESGDPVLGAELWESSHERKPAHRGGRGESKTKATTPIFSPTPLVHHLDAAFAAAYTALSSNVARRVRCLLDLNEQVGSATSRGQPLRRVIGAWPQCGRIGAANQRLDRHFVQNLKNLQTLPLASGKPERSWFGWLQSPATPRGDRPPNWPGWCRREGR